ncbi:phage tail protein [Belliella kenyensis]|uniref:Phage tail protein n=1 Tax=Belliella kenyensis TaxID=1472724 RepID=A0ABV8EKU6_9BACT|nr:phage tail protein [Belliella kenyensis]MCH7400372.1 phage tail protein [Belliella kenyensis]MDN3604610.1 phage tail protein [Belliella kenyensis]
MTYYPPVSFHFKVEFSGLSDQELDMQFQSVSGLNSEIEIEEVIEGGENRFKHAIPLRSKFSNLVLKRGLVPNSQLIDWCRKAIEDFEFRPIDLTIKLLNDKHEPLISWSVVNALPVKWSIEDLNAMESKIMIETLELRYNYFKVIK